MSQEVRSGPHPSGYGYEPGDFDGHDATGHRVTVRENRAKRRRRKRSRSSGSSDGSSSSEERVSSCVIDGDVD